MISKEDFIERKNSLEREYNELQNKRNESANLLASKQRQKIPYEVIKDILQNFGKVLACDQIERGLKKQLLHMIISEITIDNRREIESIKIHLTDDVIKFLHNYDGTPPDGVPSYFLLSRFGMQTLDLKLVI